MKVIDLFAFPITLLIFTFTMYVFSTRQPKAIRRYFIPAYLLKVIGGFSLGLIYMYYYGHGDTTAYFRVANVLNEGLNDSLSTWFRLIFDDINSPNLYEYKSRMSRYTVSSELFLVRMIALCSLVSFGSYYTTMIWFATFSFLGSWFMYRTLVQWYPAISSPLAMAIFFIPSVILWGSGLMKDTIVLGCLGFIVFSVNQIVKGKNILGIFLILIFSWLMINIRSFMFLLLILPLGMVILLRYTVRIKNLALRTLATLCGLCIVSVLILGFLELFTNQLSEFAKEAQISSNYLYRVSLEEGGSAYSIGIVDGTIQNLTKLAPAAVWVSLFRPYLWEANNVFMLLTALESFLLIISFSVIMLKTKIIGALRIIANDSFLQYALIFCLLFAFVVGITTFNFGTLARYRIPILPFFVSSLIIINYKYSAAK